MVLGFEGTVNQIPDMGSDLSRKLAIAQSRYMDKQKVAPFVVEGLAHAPCPHSASNGNLDLDFAQIDQDNARFENPQLLTKRAVSPYLLEAEAWNQHSCESRKDQTSQNIAESGDLAT